VKSEKWEKHYIAMVAAQGYLLPPMTLPLFANDIGPLETIANVQISLWSKIIHAIYASLVCKTSPGKPCQPHTGKSRLEKLVLCLVYSVKKNY